MKQKVRTLAIIGMLWSLALVAFVIVATLSEGWSVFAIAPALVLLGLHYFVFWRLFHFRRWAGVAGTVIAVWSGLAALQMFPLAMVMLAGAAYFGTTIRKAWPELMDGV